MSKGTKPYHGRMRPRGFPQGDVIFDGAADRKHEAILRPEDSLAMKEAVRVVKASTKWCNSVAHPNICQNCGRGMWDHTGVQNWCPTEEKAMHTEHPSGGRAAPRIKRDELKYSSGKVYTHAQGLSCCFRQWKAESHCNRLHGYALQVELDFGCYKLDDKGWVQDFGGLKSVKQWLENTFDHKTLVAEDDPQISIFRELAIAKMIDLVVVPGVGCESFAWLIFDAVYYLLPATSDMKVPNVWLQRVRVREHDGNWACAEQPDPPELQWAKQRAGDMYVFSSQADLDKYIDQRIQDGIARGRFNITTGDGRGPAPRRRDPLHRCT